MPGRVNNVKTKPGKAELEEPDQFASRQFVRDEDVAEQANALSVDYCIDRVQFLAERQSLMDQNEPSIARVSE